MFQKITFWLRQRHFWRRATFSELSGMYAAELLRAIALNLATVFILAFLLEKGYSLIEVIFYLIYYRILLFLFGILSVHMIAFWGGRRCLEISNFCYIPTLIVFSTYDLYGQISIAIGGMLMALGAVMHTVSYNVFFSEIKTSQNSGKEIGYMIIFHKIAGIVSPLIGGLVATYFGAEKSMWTAAILFVVASFFLARSEPLAKKHHNIKFRGFPWGSYSSMFLGQFGRGFETISGSIWPIFVTLFIASNFGSYKIIGGLSSLNALIVLIGAWALGRMVDRHSTNMRQMFKLGVLIQSIAIAFQGFMKHILSAALIEQVFAVGTITFTMPYTKARFDAADLSGSRVMMELMMNAMWNLGAIVASFILLFFLIIIPNAQEAMMRFFMLASIVYLLFGMSNFPMFRQRK